MINNTGESKAVRKDQNNKWLDKIVGNNDLSNMKPTNILCEKSKLGKSSKPNVIPKMIDLNIFLDLILLL